MYRDLQQPYTAQVDMDIIWRMVTTTDGTLTSGLISISRRYDSSFFVHHRNATRVICVNGFYERSQARPMNTLIFPKAIYIKFNE